MGMLSKSDKTEDVHKLRDVKKEAYNQIQEDVPEEQKFFEDEQSVGKCPKCEQLLKTNDLQHAIFYNCKYEVRFVMKKGNKTEKVYRKGIIAH